MNTFDKEKVISRDVWEEIMCRVHRILDRHGEGFLLIQEAIRRVHKGKIACAFTVKIYRQLWEGGLHEYLLDHGFKNVSLDTPPSSEEYDERECTLTLCPPGSSDPECWVEFDLKQRRKTSLRVHMSPEGFEGETT